MKLFWLTIGGIAIAAAGVLWIRQYPDAAFVAGTLGVLAWFLSYRVQMKSIITSNELGQHDNGVDLNEDMDN
jgi:hypothetical protein